MVDQALANDRHGLETAMRMAREARHRVAVVHAPAVLAAEVLAEVATGQRRVGPEPAVRPRIGVVVIDAEQERIDRFPGESERLDLDDGWSGHGLPHKPGKCGHAAALSMAAAGHAMACAPTPPMPDQSLASITRPRRSGANRVRVTVRSSARS